MTVITTPEPDTYGKYARASLLADYVELLALKGQPVRRATVADFLTDNGWNLDLIQLPESDHPDVESGVLSDQIDASHEAASTVFRQMYERRDVLAERYPYRLGRESATGYLGIHRSGHGREERHMAKQAQ